MVAITYAVPLPTLLLATLIPTVVADLFDFNAASLEKKSLDQLANGLQGAGRLRYGKRADDSFQDPFEYAQLTEDSMIPAKRSAPAVEPADYERLVEILERFNKRASPRAFGKANALLEALHGTEKLRFGRK